MENFFLPDEIISQIISRLDLKSMINHMLVCKQWRDLISGLISGDPLQFVVHCSDSLRFGDLHHITLRKPLHKIPWMKTFPLPSKQDLPCFEFVTSSCNGLVCLGGRDRREIHICNPLTGEYITVPDHESSLYFTQYDLGFCPSSNEYKLTMFTKHTLEVYTLGGAPKWRSVPFRYPKRGGAMDPAVFLGGVFYWVRTSQSILTFDLAEEVFGSIPPPRLEDGKELYRLGCMDRCLVATTGCGEHDCLELWTRKEGKSPIWTKNWVIDVAAQSSDQRKLYGQIDFKRLVVHKVPYNNERIFLMFSNNYLYSYMPGEKLVRYHYKNGPIKGLFTYNATLVSPKKLMQEGRRRRRRRRLVF